MRHWLKGVARQKTQPSESLINGILWVNFTVSELIQIKTGGLWHGSIVGSALFIFILLRSGHIQPPCFTIISNEFGGEQFSVRFFSLNKNNNSSFETAIFFLFEMKWKDSKIEVINSLCVFSSEIRFNTIRMRVISTGVTLLRYEEYRKHFLVLDLNYAVSVNWFPAAWPHAFTIATHIYFISRFNPFLIRTNKIFPDWKNEINFYYILFFLLSCILYGFSQFTGAKSQCCWTWS